MHYTLGTAAKATGKSKPTIHRAIKSGKISAEKDVNGDWIIQPAELHRVFPPVTGHGVTSNSKDVTHVTGNVTGIIELQSKLDVLLQRVTVKDEQLRMQEEQIRDAREDRDQWRKQATYLLEDKREKEIALNVRISTEQELLEKLAQVKVQQEQNVQLLAEAQGKLEKVSRSWIVRKIFKL